MLNRTTKFVPVLILFSFLLGSFSSNAQCGGGYTQAQANWDYLDVYYNSGVATGPYGTSTGTYITDAQEQSQKFAIGSNYFTMAMSSAALLNPGGGISVDNALHTGEIANYTGEDVQFNPSANGQSITITFNNEVTNLSFTLYDIDLNQAFSVAATNTLLIPQVVNVTTYAGTILTVGGIFPLPTTITANGTAVANNLNTGSATIAVAGPVKTITLTITAIGTDQVCWLSDINACVTGSFPNNYNQTGNNEPLVGPVTSQPDYFIVTPDNQSVYMVDPATRQARWLFTDASNTYVNSFGYDPVNHILYYVTDGSASNPQNNKTLKKYNFDTDAISTVIADISTLGIPTFNQGVESAAAAFYDGALYLGIEGGKYDVSGTSNDRTRETIMWRIDFDAGLNPINAYQVFASDAYNPASINTSIHDFGDFIIKNGVIYDFNTARNGSDYSQSKYHQYNLMSGATTIYNNPGTTSWNGQAGMGWSGQLYYFRGTNAGNSGLGTYDGAGVNGAVNNITLVGGGPAWPGGAGDASENFRPKTDFGDAPATYDPVANSPAAHERYDSIRIGATWDREWVKRGVTGNNDVDDGLAYTPILNPGAGASYAAQVSVHNNSGANATLIAWLDYNGNGVFDVSEAITPITVPTSATAQLFWLSWVSAPNTFVNGQSTYLRIRITSAAAGMTTSHPTGYFPIGEVEDYLVLIDDFPLATHMLDFKASLQDKKVNLNWTATEDINSLSYVVERSSDNTNWNSVATVEAHASNGTYQYLATDNNPLKGFSYYRLRIVESSGRLRFSSVKTIVNNDYVLHMIVSPNPAREKINLAVEVAHAGNATITIVSMGGSALLSKTQRLDAGLNTIPVQLPVGINSGTYIVSISTGNETVRQKLIVNK